MVGVSGTEADNPDFTRPHQRISIPVSVFFDRNISVLEALAEYLKEEYKLGFVTLKDVAARRGKWWEEEREQAEAETDDLLMRGRRLAEKHGITIEAALSLLQQRSANPPADMTDDGNQDDTTPSDESTT